MSGAASRVRWALAMPLPVLARKFVQRGRGLIDRLVAEPATAWGKAAVPSEELAAARVKVTSRFLVGGHERLALVDELRAREPEAVKAILARAEDACAHRFDLLGSGPTALGERIDWHRDFKSGHRWEPRHHSLIDYLDLGRQSDVKVVWELSRCHHWVTLGQAYWLTGDGRYATEFLAQWESWMSANPPGFGVNWACAMEVAIRGVNWLWAFVLFAEAPAFDARRQLHVLAALVAHARFILRNLETGALPGNHYLTDGIGLLTMGLVLREIRESARWLARGWDIVWGEVERQVTSDGVDYEHAIGYHGYVLQCLLFAVELCRRNAREVPRTARERIERMLEFTQAYTRADGSIPAIGDADDGRLFVLGDRTAADHQSLLAAGAALFGRAAFKAGSNGFRAEHLWWLGLRGLEAFDAIPDSPSDTPGSRGFATGGFFVMRRGDRHLIVSGSSSGPASHVHQDLLSFECWADGLPYIVDPGTFTYTASPEWRNRFRGTASHNTVMVDGAEQTRLLDDANLFPPRHDARARFALRRWESSDDLDCFDAEHTGYTRLPEPVIHRRRIWFDKRRGVWTIRDSLTGKGTHRVAGFLHLAPLEVSIRSRDPWVIEIGDAERALIVAWLPLPALHVSVTRGWLSPRYGEIRDAPVIAYEHEGPLPTDIAFVLAPTRRGMSLDAAAVLAWATDQR